MRVIHRPAILQGVPMKKWRIIVTSLVMLAFVSPIAPARAEMAPNWLTDFLGRYKPANIAVPPSAALMAQDLAQRINSGQLPLSTGDVINLMLQNNLDVGVNRLSPLSSQYQIDLARRPFEPILRLGATVNRN